MKKSIKPLQIYLKNKHICLIGNARSVLKRKKTFDKYDIICRCNRGIPLGKAEYIGSRTDILFLSTRLHGTTITRKFNPKYVVWMTRWNNLVMEWVKKNAIQNPIKDYNELLKQLPALPSTGCIALYFLIKNIKFKSLTIFGVDFFATGSWYHSMKKADKAHNVKAEKALILKLIKETPNVEIIYE